MRKAVLYWPEWKEVVCFLGDIPAHHAPPRRLQVSEYVFFDECILRKAKGGVGGSNWKENLGIWERKYSIEQIPELPVEEVGSRAHKEELVSIVWRKTSPSQPGEKKEKMEVDRDSMEEHWGVHFWWSQGFPLRRGCQDARRERSRSEASLRERSKSWPKGCWSLEAQ